MVQKRRKCKLANSDYSNVDLRQFEETIIEIVNQTVPGKNPKVYEKYFSTDVLTQSEAVSLGRALAKIEKLKTMGKTVTIFRLFDGRVCECDESKEQTNTKKHKGGRMA